MLARIPATAAPELELKFQLGEGAVLALADLFPMNAGETFHLSAAYFDTPDYRLRDGGFSLRVRGTGERYIQTLKHRGDGGLFERDEWEVEVVGPRLDHAALSGTPAEAVIGDASVVTAFTVDVERRLHVWAWGDTRIEVTFDSGSIATEDGRDTVAEMELELVAGPPEALFALARQLQSSAALTLAFESKAERGYRLAGHDGVAALKARQPNIGPSTTGAEAFQAVAREALVQIAGNARLLDIAPNPEVLHQTRVGLRRLRAALSVFREMLDAEGLDFARDETRWLAGELSVARDLDVFLQRAASPDDVDDTPGRAAFYRAVSRARAEAYDQAGAAIRSARYRTLLLELGAWIETGAWLTLADDTRAGLRDAAVQVLAAPALDRLQRRLRRRAKGFKRLGPKARHDLRKRAKTLRYAASFLGGAYDRRANRKAHFIESLQGLQQQLGELNDIATARSVALRAVGKRSGELAFAAGLEVGRIAQAEDAALKAAGRTLRAYKRRKVFWTPGPVPGP